jgi:hypothetical protein
MGRQLPGISSELRDALDQLDVLTDEEQDIVDSWLRSGYRTSLYEVGIGDDVIGPHRSDIEDHPADAPALPAALTKIANVPPSARLISALRSLQAVSKLEFDAIANWFKFENRGDLYTLGASDEDIGTWRTIPDGIWSNDPRYAPRS